MSAANDRAFTFSAKLPRGKGPEDVIRAIQNTPGPQIKERTKLSLEELQRHYGPGHQLVIDPSTGQILEVLKIEDDQPDRVDADDPRLGLTDKALEFLREVRK